MNLKKSYAVIWSIGIFLALLLLISLLFSFLPSPEPSSPAPPRTPAVTEKDKAVQRAAAGAVLLKKAMRNPDSFKLESALVVDGTNAVCYEYRSQNGFGGMNAGRAFISPDGQQFLLSEPRTDGFDAIWNRECANKSGTNAATLIRWKFLQ